MKNHRLIDERSLAFHRLIAQKVRARPASLQKAHENIGRWLPDASSGVRRVLIEWRVLLDGPLDDLFAIMEGAEERAARLRQSSPFAGFLSREERHVILQDFQRHESAAACAHHPCRRGNC